MQRRHSLSHLLLRTAIAAAGSAGVVSGLYPLGNQLLTAIGRRRLKRRQPPGLVRAVALEWAVALAVSAARPLGLFGLPVSGPPARGPRPVLLLHGYAMGRMNFFLLARRLHRAGLGPLVGFEYASLGSIRRAAAALGAFVDQLTGELGTRVDLVGHSLGGVVARTYVCDGAGAGRVENLITIGSPHAGTWFSRFGVGSSSVEAKVDSPFLRELASRPIPPGVRATAIWSRADGLVSSPLFARLPGAEEIVYDDLGHLTMLASPRVAAEVIARLRRTGSPTSSR